ncbi:hypothetical protein GLOIN_2v53507 [Rhizophagus irregularis DAOM 181602=DAOM 197198]|uniref:Uncharacterized protein n=1 Tax=Rhizophagus irregularis (strain DAOM 181602 / DAOM 197198 / MUCL 43194) TaxID=747089 RepID=A0A2P4Q1L9_RHIID|nr:hypothetical protein GLOIN_2v53507 [Rhizophagus irregularis DAOM 181602=DAOM 197198]POG71533.1 hypothetical protein GLOIN_2v53507 [Rhizophagus irregularis DAOM 181602=DAOM 197198]|eukprot:XP_025178399.1 hypothetical protein GLOIN_2v53507 [Rhizophagus irregularis DAOM 181602=DAOM 197198]
MSREDDNNDPRSLKRKFDMDLLTAEVAKLGQVDVPPPSHSPMMHHQSHYPREHPIRSMSTPQPMVGLEPTHSAMSEIEYRMRSTSPFGPNHHNPKVQTSSPLAMLPEIPFSPFQPNNNYLRHRSPEPISGVSPANSRSASMDTYSRSRIQLLIIHQRRKQELHQYLILRITVKNTPRDAKEIKKESEDELSGRTRSINGWRDIINNYYIFFFFFSLFQKSNYIHK